MKELSLEDTRPYQLSILDSIDLCCKNNNIKYSLGFGTLLGAVRHKGFIPWDDDIDLFMTRDNYNKFIDAYNDNRYKMLSNRDKDWGWSYIRVYDPTTAVIFKESYESVRKHGIWVSVFPFDHLPDDKYERKKIKNKVNFYHNLCRVKRSQWAPTGLFLNIAKLIGRVLLSPFSILYFSKKQEQTSCKYNSIPTKLLFSKIVTFNECPAECFSSYTTLEFEGKQYMAVANYDLCLKTYYNKYMVLPPESKRIPTHDYSVFVK